MRACRYVPAAIAATKIVTDGAPDASAVIADAYRQRDRCCVWPPRTALQHYAVRRIFDASSTILRTIFSTSDARPSIPAWGKKSAIELGSNVLM